jgi:DNA-binding protein H-NS
MATQPQQVSETPVPVNLAEVLIPDGAASIEDVIAGLEIEELNEAARYITVVKAQKVQAKANEVKAAFLKLAEGMGLTNKEALGTISAFGGGVARGGSLPVKYQGPNGETWTGRGATPKWLIEQLEAGHKRDDFAIA